MTSFCECPQNEKNGNPKRKCPRRGQGFAQVPSWNGISSPFYQCAPRKPWGSGCQQAQCVNQFASRIVCGSAIGPASSGSAGGIGSILDRDDEGSILDDIAGMVLGGGGISPLKSRENS